MRRIDLLNPICHWNRTKRNKNIKHDDDLTMTPKRSCVSTRAITILTMLWMTSAVIYPRLAWAVLACGEKLIGNACTTTGQSAVDCDTIAECTAGGTWVRAPLMLGSNVTACAAGTSGEMQWSGTSLQYCNGTKWIAFGGGGTLSLSAMTGALATNNIEAGNYL